MCTKYRGRTRHYGATERQAAYVRSLLKRLWEVEPESRPFLGSERERSLYTVTDWPRCETSARIDHLRERIAAAEAAEKE